MPQNREKGGVPTAVAQRGSYAYTIEGVGCACYSSRATLGGAHARGDNAKSAAPSGAVSSYFSCLWVVSFFLGPRHRLTDPCAAEQQAFLHRLVEPADVSGGLWIACVRRTLHPRVFFVSPSVFFFLGAGEAFHRVQSQPSRTLRSFLQGLFVTDFSSFGSDTPTTPTMCAFPHRDDLRYVDDSRLSRTMLTYTAVASRSQTGRWIWLGVVSLDRYTATANRLTERWIWLGVVSLTTLTYRSTTAARVGDGRRNK